ncbi:MAG: glutamate decarboxylase [Solirubrobacteraceae bacterium]
MALHTKVPPELAEEPLRIRPQNALDPDLVKPPRYRLADSAMPATTAYRLITDELTLDGNARLNLATFVTTWMEPEACRLMAECAEKNLIDKDEYPVTAEIEARCVNIVADLWNAPDEAAAMGCSTIGSSEACMLAGLAFKFRWRRRGPAGGGRPNLVMGENVQVCWEKFCRYWDVEPRKAKLHAGATHLTAETAIPLCDENTIGVVAILGSTYDGTYEPVAEIAAALDRLEAERGLDIPLHVDAASGGFVAPFLDADLVWDFRLPRVHSINGSGHKYGLVYPGVGWLVWRDQAKVPEELVFKVDYLGGEMPTFTLNFSRPGSEVIAQYFNFLHLGREGYTRVLADCRETARWLAARLAELDEVELISDGSGIPAFAFKLRDGLDYTVYDVSDRLRRHGWQVPAYRFPPDLEELAVLRVVVRNGFGRDLAEHLLGHLRQALADLAAGGRKGEERGTGFHH